MGKKHILAFSIILILGLLLFILPKSKKMDIDSTPVQTQERPKDSKSVLKVFLENSGSMDGYMCDGSEFKDAIKGLVSCMTSDFDLLSLNYINTAIIPRKNDNIRSFITNMNPTQFKNAGGNRENTDIGDLIEKVVNNTGKNTVSIFISDCILDIPQKTTDFFIDKQIDVTNAIKKFKNSGNNSVIVIQLESIFRGTYFGVDGTTYLNREKRPYYIWMFGRADLLANAIKDTPIKDIKHGVKNWISFGNKQVIPFQICNKYGKAPKSIKPTGNNYEIQIKADLSSLLKSDELLTNITNYQADNMNSVKVKSVNKTTVQNYTHIISLAINKNITSCSETISYIHTNETPSWIENSNDNTGKDIKKNINKTTGIKYLIQGVAEAYKQDNSLGEIHFVIKNI